MKNILADRLEIWGFEGDFILFSDSSIGFGLDVTPLDVSCWNTDRINDLSHRTAQFLNGLQDRIDIQFVQDITGGNESIIAAHEKIGEKSENVAALELTAKRAAKFRKLDQDGILPKHSLKLFVRRPMTTSLVDRPKLLSNHKRFESVAEKKLEREIHLTEQLRETLVHSLQSLDLPVQTLHADQILNLLYGQWNPCRNIERGRYDPENVRSGILFTDALISERGFALSEMRHRLISLKILPDQTYASMASSLRSLPFDSKFFLSIHVPNQTKELEALQTQRRLAFSMARGKKSGVSDIESEAKLQDLETLLEQMIAQGEKVFQVSCNVLLRSKDKDELENQVSQTLSLFRELGGGEAMEETLAAFDIFTELALPNARAKERMKRLKTSTLSDFLPIYGPWRGFDRPSILLRTRMGSLLGFDPFSSELSNANQLISGGSGSGKSYLTNILTIQMLKENPKVFFVDIGGSYKKLCENLSGQYLPLGVDNGISLNPFDLVAGETAPSSEKIKFLLGLIELITKEDSVERLPKLERAELEESICRVYEGSGPPRLSKLREILLFHPDTSMKRFGRILTPWCGDTAFGRFLDRETNIQLNNPIVAFDLKGMESFQDLQAVCLFVITDLVWREVQKDRSQMKFLVFDECWKLLKNEAGLVFIEEVFRTFRKYYASAIAISQDIDDFAKSKIAGALLPNCSIKWLLSQNQSDSSRLQEVLGLNDSEIKIIRSLSQKKGIYSEAFLVAQNHHTSVVIESTPLEYWIATTDPKDLAALDAFTAKNTNLSKIETLNALSEMYPNGVASYERDLQQKRRVS